MSCNLTIKGYGVIYQTPSETTRRILREAKGNTVLETDLSALELWRADTHQWSDPPLLQGKDARNAYLIEGREWQIAQIDENFDRARDFIIAQGGKQRLVEGW